MDGYDGNSSLNMSQTDVIKTVIAFALVITFTVWGIRSTLGSRHRLLTPIYFGCLSVALLAKFLSNFRYFEASDVRILILRTVWWTCFGFALLILAFQLRSLRRKAGE